MFDVHCQACHRRYLVGSSSITSFQNTPEGPVAEVQCPKGHHLVRYFWSGATKTVQAAA
jgi:hypothetical protein